MKQVKTVKMGNINNGVKNLLLKSMIWSFFIIKDANCDRTKNVTLLITVSST